MECKPVFDLCSTGVAGKSDEESAAGKLHTAHREQTAEGQVQQSHR